MAALSTVSVRPSTLMAPDAAAAAASSGFPECVLLNKTACISGGRNATTASCRTLDGQPVAVSFWLADPPEVSRFSVHCPGIEDQDLSDRPPFIISAEGAFVLFCVTLDESDHHFVYSARGVTTGKKKNKPSLHLLPDPKPMVEAFESQQFGILPLGDGEHYAVAFLDHQWNSRDNAWVYRAHVFSSETKRWRRSKQALLHLSESDRLLFDRHASSKQITVGASSLGFVDLLRGIVLVSNLFDERPVITYIPLPAEKVCITDKHGNPHYAPEYFCDVACCDNGDDGDLIRFVEIEFEDPGCRTNGKAWKATIWNWKVSSKDDEWRKHRTVDVAKISVDPSYSALLPGLLLDGKLELKNLCFLNPTLSVHDDDLIYTLAKLDQGDDTAWVLAVDMKRATLQALVPVSTKESGAAITMYKSCAFPKYYINNITSSDMRDPVEKDKSNKLQQERPNSNETRGNLQKKRQKKKKQGRLVSHRVQQPFLLYFVGCIFIAIIVKVYCHLS